MAEVEDHLVDHGEGVSVEKHGLLVRLDIAKTGLCHNASLVGI